MKFDDKRVQRIYNQIRKTVKAAANEKRSCTQKDYNYYLKILHDIGITKYDSRLKVWLNLSQD